MTAYRWLAPLALTLCLEPACDPQTCTLVGCGSTLDLVVEGEDGGALPDSTYEIVLELDGAVYSTACGSPEPGMLMCEPVEGPSTFVIEAVGTTTGTISMSVFSSEGGGEGPKTARLTIVAGDAPLVDETWDVTYETDAPNGEECGPICYSATETLAVTIEEG